MKTKIQNKIAGLGNAIRIAVKTEKGRWQQAESVTLQPALGLNQSQSIYSSVKYAEFGIPFSLLND